MIISHKYRFIFLKTRRTGGSSFEQAVAPYLGEDDIATGSKTDNTPRKNLDDDSITGHIPWWKIEEIAGTDVFESYFKFCFERNSYEKAASEWVYKNPNLSSSHSLEEWTRANPVSDIKRYYSGFGGGQFKFLVFQYHRLTYIPMIRGLLAMLGIPPDAINGIHLKETECRHYLQNMDLSEFFAIVNSEFSAEIEAFNYQPWITL